MSQPADSPMIPSVQQSSASPGQIRSEAMVQQARIIVRQLDTMNSSLEMLIGFLTLVGMFDSEDRAGGPPGESQFPASQSGSATV